MSIEEKFTQYLQMNKEMGIVRKQLKEQKKQCDNLEKEIKDYMQSNEMDSISLQEGEIVLYSRKISQTFRKENIVEKLTEKLNNSEKAEELADSIISNKKFVLEDKIKAVIKKQK